MPYLIDGHNLIGKLPDIDLTDPNDEAKLVQKLIGFCGRHQTQVVVVFDQGLPGGKSRMSTRKVTVVFASHRSNADRVMMERIRKTRDPANWTVVSSDNEVLATGRRYKMNTIKAAQFAQMLERPAPPPRPGRDVAVDVRLSGKEVDEWLSLFDDTEHNPVETRSSKPARSRR